MEILIVIALIFLGTIIAATISGIREANWESRLTPKQKENYDKMMDFANNKIKEYQSKNAGRILTIYAYVDKKGIHLYNDPREYIRYRVDHELEEYASDEKIIPLSEIKYYELNGSVHKEQIISGGGGGGSSIKGAVIGGMIAGDAGAIIGSRKKIEEVKTTYQEVDDRKVILTMNKPDEYDEDDTELPFECYEQLLDYIPEKEYDNYINSKKMKGAK